jgi:hypothetical protein
MNAIPLTSEKIAQLVSQHCSASDWKQVFITSGCDLKRINNVQFEGLVRIGDTSGGSLVDGIELPCGLYGATILNCDIGDHVRIANIGSVLSNYIIENNVVIQDVAALASDVNASFGNGVELETINEGGGRGVRILNDLTSQIAYIQGMMRHNASFSKMLERLVEAKAKQATSERGRIAEHARVLHCGTIHNVNIGRAAYVHGAQSLENGTVNSCIEHPTEVGEGVQAKSFILSEGARVESGALLDKAYVGQGVKMGKQYSAENSLFFANCEAFHGEAVSLFAGPYTVTHHKSTLLIAGYFSFYNAGSGTNQSNHMYKLGPVHQGILERGSKTGSFSYLLFEAHIGAFSVVIGKHYSNLDLPNLPFSYIKEEDGATKVSPAMNLIAVGTVRDGEKWPKRDGRKAPHKRDLIIFDVFSPYVVEKMRRGRNELLRLAENVTRDKVSIPYGGAQISRLFLKKGAGYYAMAVKRYLYEKVMDKMNQESQKHKNWNSLVASLKPVSLLNAAHEWTDVAGLLTPSERLTGLEERVTNGSVKSYDELLAEFQAMYDSYRSDEWHYVYEVFGKEFGFDLAVATKEQLMAAADEWENSAAALLSAITEDSKKEFGAFARIGYGLGQSDENKKRDFEAVRGTVETNSVVQKLAAEGAALRQRKEQFKELVTSIPV